MSTRRRPYALGSVLGWALPLGLAAGLLLPALRSASAQHRLDATMDALVEALWSYRAAAEHWPELHPATAAELVPLLLDGGHLAEPPLNPATGAPYGSDPFEVDRIWYGLEEDGAHFVLEALGEDGVRVRAARRSVDP